MVIKETPRHCLTKTSGSHSRFLFIKKSNTDIRTKINKEKDKADLTDDFSERLCIVDK